MAAFTARDLAAVLMTDEGRVILERSVTTIQVRIYEEFNGIAFPESIESGLKTFRVRRNCDRISVNHWNPYFGWILSTRRQNGERRSLHLSTQEVFGFRRLSSRRIESNQFYS